MEQEKQHSENKQRRSTERELNNSGENLVEGGKIRGTSGAEDSINSWAFEEGK